MARQDEWAQQMRQTLYTTEEEVLMLQATITQLEHEKACMQGELRSWNEEIRSKERQLLAYEESLVIRGTSM